MIAETLLHYLNENIRWFEAYMEAPDNLNGYVLIDQTGSSRTNHIITTTFAIQSYGETLYDTMILNNMVREAMENFAELNEIIKVELETDYNFTDTTTKQYRWQAVYHITHY